VVPKRDHIKISFESEEAEELLKVAYSEILRDQLRPQYEKRNWAEIERQIHDGKYELLRHLCESKMAQWDQRRQTLRLGAFYGHSELPMAPILGLVALFETDEQRREVLNRNALAILRDLDNQ
jgi:hypothetical protein